jgi:ketosteroid isomerase-like protein
MVYALILLCSLAVPSGPSDSKAEKEVLAALNTWREAMVARDRAVLEEIYAPSLSYTHSDGRQENKAQAIEAVVNGKDRIESIELTGTSVSVYGTTALVKTKQSMRMNSGGTMNTLTLDVLYVWIKSSSRWQMVARHALRLNP